MTTAITNSPLNDGISSYAAIERLPRLIAEEEPQLLADLRLASRAPAAKARLIEGYLPRVLTLAKQYDRRYRVITYDDLVQEGSLALMQAIDKCATMPITKSLSRYIGTVVRSAFSRAIGTDAPIHMPNSTWHYIHNSGRVQQYAWMQTMRLDALRNADGETFAETIPAPALLLSAGEQEQEQQYDEQCRQLVPLLAMLSDRRRRVLTLRYGLDPADARCHSREETARLLGLSPGTVYDAEQRAIVTLRHLYETMTATGASSSPETLTGATSPTLVRLHKPITAGQRQYHQRQHAEQQVKVQTEADAPVVGVDVGIANFLTTSDGKHYGTFNGKLRERQKRDREKRRRKAKLRKCLEKKGLPKDKLPSTTSRTGQRLTRHVRQEINRAVNLCFEDHEGCQFAYEQLSVASMRFKAHAMNAYMKASNLGHIPDQIAWNATKRGVTATRIKSAYSSQECSGCHYVDRKNRPDQQTFCCRVCGYKMHADENASRNIAARLHDEELRACKDRKAIKALLLSRHEAWKKQHGWP